MDHISFMQILKGEDERKKSQKLKEKNQFILIRYRSNHNSSSIQSKRINIENQDILEVV